MMKFKYTILMFAAMLLPTVACAASDYEAPSLQPAGSMRAWLIIALFLVGALVPLLKSFRLDGQR